ncbi:ATP12 family chaperone protein [Lutibaculum baratangense]|uniref:Chaperone required for the assembly of the mitochondrial F1-ATPase n=1 Tax=Lutibaculum baratangense AMV1 TaxID=631454 RepID=V4RKH1_9HYPH|nr:ATP12 family protein [Lutibaculum baratangense]ESR26546.1 hypothetical protein N177_0765 [Lutibaculum baratangense AMV1]
MTDKPDPTRRAQELARAELPRRFYEAVTVEAGEAGHVIRLDSRNVRTPARRLLALPTSELAELVAEEWRAQGERIDPSSMPVNRIVNSALDGVAVSADAVREDVVRFLDSDLLCYRADSPERLVEWQNAAWDPPLAWARESLGLDLRLAAGIVHVEQPPQTLERGAGIVARYETLPLAGLHVMTSLTGSIVLALAVVEGHMSPDDAWAAAHVDEDWQISQWGEDAEAMRRRQARWAEMRAAALVARHGRGGR